MTTDTEAGVPRITTVHIMPARFHRIGGGWWALDVAIPPALSPKRLRHWRVSRGRIAHGPWRKPPAGSQGKLTLKARGPLRLQGDGNPTLIASLGTLCEIELQLTRA